MASTFDKHPLDVEMRPIDSPVDEQIGETYALETRDRNKLFQWAYWLDEKVDFVPEELSIYGRAWTSRLTHHNIDWARSSRDGTNTRD